MLCKVCGAQIPDDAKECEFCGAKTNGDNTNDEEIFEGVSDETKIIDSEEIKQLAEENTAADERDESEEIFDDNERRRREQMKKMMEDKRLQLSEIERRRNEKRQKQKRNRILLIGLICALAVAAAGIGVYYVAQNVGTPATVDETPMPTISATMPVMPSASPTVAPSPELSMTAAPAEANASSTNNSNNQSWTATGNGGSSSGKTNTASSGSSSSSSNKTTSGGGSSASSGKNTASGTSSGSAASGGNTASNGSSPTAISNSGTSTNKISSQLATGGEVIYNTGTGRYLMTFVTGNTRYYANVSAGSTTEQIKNKPYTITAEPTSETYNGNTVYEITTFTKYDGNYLLPNSGTKLLTNNDIKGMSKYDLALARNEIYARHGRKFQTAEYNTYFSGKSWYSINPNYNYSDDNSNLNEIEAKNVQFLLNAERK